VRILALRTTLNYMGSATLETSRKLIKCITARVLFLSVGIKLNRMFGKKKIVYVAVPERQLSDITAEKLLLELKQDLNNFGSALSDSKLGELKGKITGIEFMIGKAKIERRQK